MHTDETSVLEQALALPAEQRLRLVDALYVIAVANLRRRPGYWQDRLSWAHLGGPAVSVAKPRRREAALRDDGE
jgi:hypothetical protein